MIRLFLGNLPYQTTVEDIFNHFETAGFVVSKVQIATHKATGESRGFGFAECEDYLASDLIHNMDRTNLLGRTINVNVARPREDRPSGRR